ncbi:CFI-box-CTERM domain-containing protein [Candidatus Nitrosotenuis chungbukensis]|uniref:CFI-box-CTERM domain-containing protein n=1 Tax=Candidatus Nitrosotenuis chungbukensis TaxID=1353246 RepID=UPI000B22E68D|nr:CFI-box-CTERM domain-containing protein [Candidatus Nitrosotenuis chungbukensis]
MRHTFSFPFFLFILLSPFTLTGNAYALTPVADLTGEWSGFAQVSYDGTTCAVSGKVNGFFEQDGNDLHGEFSFVPTSTTDDTCSYEPWDLVVDGTIDGSRVTLFDHSGINFSGWYASSGIKLDFAADWGHGTTQLSPTGFSPPAYQQDEPAPQCRADQELVGDQCQCPAGEEETNGICQMPEEPDGDGDTFPDSDDACPNDPEDSVGIEDGCPEDDQADEFAEEDPAESDDLNDVENESESQDWAEEDPAESDDLNDVENESESQDWTETGESSVGEDIKQILQDRKIGNLQVHEGSATITTDDGTIVDSNDLKIGDMIQTGENADTNVKIALENGAGVISMRENTKIDTAGIVIQDDSDLSFLFDTVDKLKQDSAQNTGVDQDLSFLFDTVDDLKQKSRTEQVYEQIRPVLEKTGLSDEKTYLLASSFFAGGLIGLIPSGGTSAALIATGYLMIVGSLYYDYDTRVSEEEQNNIIFTPDAALVPHGTEFTVTVQDGATKLNVLEGEVYVVPYDAIDSIMTISAGDSILVSADKIEKTKLDVASTDKWWDTTVKAEPPTTTPKSGGCLIATAAFGSELAPQVQLLREMRDNVLLSTNSGTSFMTGFNQFYYLFSPTIADWERQNPAFKEIVKMTITPMLSTLSILNYVDIDSEQDLLAYGIGIMLLNIGMYFVLPALVILKLKDRSKKNQI